MLLHLQESKDFVTLDNLSEVLNISKRSVQNYLNKAELWFEEHDITEAKLVKKQGCGIALSIGEEDNQKLSNLLNSRYFTLADGSVDRRIELIRLLVLSRDELTIQFLADQFYVSRFTILSDLDWAEAWLSKFKLKLFKTQRRGIGIVGDEVSRRAAIAAYFDLKEQKEPYAESYSANVFRLAIERLQKMEEIYNEADIKKICSIIEEAEKEFDFYMDNEYYTSLVTHITISVYRLRNGCTIKKEFMPPEGDFPQMEMNTSMFIAKRLEKTFSIKLPDSECKYICIHLMSYNAFHEENENERRVPESIEMLTIHLIEAVENSTGGGFSSDKLLFFGIAHHLKSSIYQQKENPGVRSSRNLEVPADYKEIYESVKNQSKLYKEYSGIKPDEQELLALTLYFALSQERTTYRKRALLVSGMGILPLLELRSYLQKKLPQINIVDACSVYQLSLYPENAYDFIITTVQIDKSDKPIADISHQTKAQMVKNLEEFCVLGM